MLPHPSLATLLIVPERKEQDKRIKLFQTTVGRMKWPKFLNKIYILGFQIDFG